MGLQIWKDNGSKLESWSISVVVDALCTIIHYSDIIMGTMVSQITSLVVVYSTVYPGADQRKH